MVRRRQMARLTGNVRQSRTCVGSALAEGLAKSGPLKRTLRRLESRRSGGNRMEGDFRAIAMGEVAFDVDVGEPEPQALGGGVGVGELGIEALVGGFLQMFRIEGAGGMGNQHDSLKVVNPDQEI